MARPTQEAIDTFVSITGADEAAAVRVLEEHGSDLNEAVNAYFNEGDRSTTRINQNPVPASDDDMELDEPLDHMFNRPLFPRTLGNPFSLLGPSYADITAGDIFGGRPRVTHPRNVRQIPIEVKDSNTQTGSSGQGPVIEDVTGRESFYGPEVHGTVIADEDDEDLPSTPSAHDPNIPSSTSRPNHSMPSAPPDYNNDIEEEMIRAAIEASKREAEGIKNGPNSSKSENVSRGRGDDELAQAVSLSLETAEQERALRQEGMHVVDHSPDLSDKEDTERASWMIDSGSCRYEEKVAPMPCGWVPSTPQHCTYVVPRIKVFGPDHITASIMADCFGIKGDTTTRLFGRGKVRSKEQVVYKRHAGNTDSGLDLPVHKLSDSTISKQDEVGALPVGETTLDPSQDMYTMVVVKAYKAKCLKHLTAAWTAIEFETDELVRQLARCSLSRDKATQPMPNAEQSTHCNAPTPCTDKLRRGKVVKKKRTGEALSLVG